MYKKEYILIYISILTALSYADFNPFAVRTVDISLNSPSEPNHLPAPGQRINIAPWKYETNALGAPSGGGLSTPNNDNVVTLGGFGGQIVLAFDHDVEDHHGNPQGLDAIIYSNSLWRNSDPNEHWAEFAHIEIMPELNDNDTPGDDPCEIWYVIPGSHLQDGNTWRTQNWTSGIFGYPAYNSWPTSYDTSAYEIFPEYVDTDPGTATAWTFINPYAQDEIPDNNHLEGIWGYGGYSPTLRLGDRNADDFNEAYGDSPDMPPELFYTVPDDPFTVGIDAGASGGDAFDISWAVDPLTWLPANIQSFRYIRLTTAVDIRQLGVLGEISAEIDAVADARSYGDINGDGQVDYTDFELFTLTWLSEWSQAEFDPSADHIADNKIDLLDYAAFANGFQ